ncbi:MAG: DNA alkylation repair protein, partial [Oscillospiraceae bacterium]|nr:DNA alkylation repair protein [Oscillospiraceae bacterium]
MTEIQEKLFALQDAAYGDFNAKLLPTVDRARIIGVRTPALRKLARELLKTADTGAFMARLPHAYFEEDGLHAAFIEAIKDFDACLQQVERFLPYVDNWATCDSLSPACFKKNRDRLIPDVRRWLESERLYTVRFGIGMLMQHFLDADFDLKYPEAVASVRSEEYYIRMMVAWYFA